MKILIVEDEHRIANTLKKGLEQEHFSVDIAYDGILGLDLASAEKYDVIVLDRMLPGLGGIEIVQRLRSKALHTPIILLTAKGQIEDKVEGLNAGADDYLIKPFSFEELLARIRALIRRPTNVIDSTLTVEDLTLDTKRYVVRRQDTIISLTSKEFSLLEYLMRHKGLTLSKATLIQSVWNYDADILPNTVEVYIRNLRKKIDDSFHTRKPLIHTVRGFGYKIGE